MKIIHYILSVVIFFYPSFSKSTIFIDIDQRDLSSAPHTRIAVFNVSKQEFLHLTYFNLTTPREASDGKEKGKAKEEIALIGEYEGFRFSNNGDVQIPNLNDRTQKYIIRTKGNLLRDAEDESPIRQESTVGDLRKIFFTSTAGSFKAGEHIHERFNTFTDASTTPHFKVKFFSYTEVDERKFSSIVRSDKNANSIERGDIGELATEMTMISWGYQKLPSQFEGGQGFDGVFVSKHSEPYLFLAESKCRQESVSAESYLKNTLNEAQIFERLKKPELAADTKQRIQSFIKDSPDRIYKVAYRLKLTGSAQCASKPFDDFSFQCARISNGDLSHTSLPEDHVRFFKNLFEKTGMSPHLGLDSLLESLGLSTQEKSAMLIQKSVNLLVDEELSKRLGGVLKIEDGAPVTLVPTVVAKSTSKPSQTPSQAMQVNPTLTVTAKNVSKSPHTPSQAKQTGSSFSENEEDEESNLLSSSKNGNEQSYTFSSPLTKISEKSPSSVSSSGKTPIPPSTSPFGQYEEEKLAKFISLLDSKGVGRGKMEEFYNTSKPSHFKKLSDKTFRNLKGASASQAGKEIWYVFTENFKKLMSIKKGVNEKEFLKEYQKNFALTPLPTLTASSKDFKDVGSAPLKDGRAGAAPKINRVLLEDLDKAKPESTESTKETKTPQGVPGPKKEIPTPKKKTTP